MSTKVFLNAYFMLSLFLSLWADHALAAQYSSEHPIYQDTNVNVYEVKERRSSSRNIHLRVIHNAATDAELFDVIVTINTDGSQTYEYGNGIYEQAKQWLGERYINTDLRQIRISHYLDNASLETIPILIAGNWEPSFGPGRPIATYELLNANRPRGRAARQQGLLNVQSLVKWTAAIPGPTDNHIYIGRGFLNTYIAAKAWQQDGQINVKNNARTARLNSLTIPDAKKTDIDAISAFGHNKATLINTIGTTQFFLTKSTSPEYLDVAVLHTGINDDGYVIELDPLLTRDERGEYVLSYILVPDEIEAFNKALGKKLREIDSTATTVQVRHYVVGKTAGKLDDRWSGKSNEIPVFAQAYNWVQAKGEWRPEYENVNNKNRSGIGRFNSYGTRYSVNSTKAYVEYLNKKDRNPSLRFTETPIEELIAALASGSTEMRQRHEKYALWSDGYWAYHKIPIARDIINGDFNRVKMDRNFRYLFVNFLKAYSETCQAYMKNPKVLQYILTEKEIDAHGFTMNEDITTISVVLEEEYVNTYDNYWNNKSDRAAVMLEAFKSFNRDNKQPGYTSEFFRSLDYLQAGRTMLRVDECSDPAPQRLLKNLLRLTKNEAPIKSGISLVAHEQ